MIGLEISHVSYSYGKSRALDDVSFSVRTGRFCALLGPNGAGKSTLFALLTRLLATRAGTIGVAGFDIAREPRAALARIGVVFQQPTLDLDMSVRRNLRYFAGLHGLSGRQAAVAIEAALTQLGMAERADEQVRALNGGHRRRMEIARALIHKPQILLLDEPTVGLDAAPGRRSPTMCICLPRAGLRSLGDASGRRDPAGGPGRRSASRQGAERRHRRGTRGRAGARQGVPVDDGRGPGGSGMKAWLVALSAIVTRENLRFVRQRGRFLAALVRPLVWLIVFAAGFRAALGVSIIPPYQTYITYEVYILPGLCGMIQLFNGMQSSLALVYDQEMGSMRLLLTSPLPRWWLLFSKLLAGVIVSILQVAVFLAIAALTGITVPPVGYVAVLPALVISGLMLGAFGLLISSTVRQLENFAGVMNFVIFPMFFLSSALYPLWKMAESSPLLRDICALNPFTTRWN